MTNVSPSTARRCFARLAIGSAAFTLFGSLVPLEFRARPVADAADSFAWAMTNRAIVQSRSDGVANVLLGVPLGFALIGMLCADRRVEWVRAARLGLAVLPACAAFAAAVEFLQLFVPVRTCAGSDVLAQIVGATVGVAVWFAIGQRLTDEVRAAAAGTGTAGRLLVGYILFLAFVQSLPLDLTLSPYKAYYKLRGFGEQAAPFAEFWTPSNDAQWERAAALLKLATLYVPAGLIAGRIPGRFWAVGNAGGVALAAVALAAGIEAAQVLVESRMTSATDGIVGAAAAFAGWAYARARPGSGLSPGDLIGLGFWWLLLLGVVSWQPFEFADTARPFDWIPGAPLEAANPLLALEHMLTKLVIFALGGALVASFDQTKPGPATCAAAAVLGLAVSALFEVGQRFTADHTPGITDVVLGGLGAACGAWVAITMRRDGSGEQVA